MAKFRKLPVEIEAVKWCGANIGLTNGGEPMVSERLELPKWMPTCEVFAEDDPGAATPSVQPGAIKRWGDYLFIGTLEGIHRADPGDWIIRGVKGELYPCKPDIFAATYEVA